MSNLHFRNTPEYWKNVGSKMSKAISDRVEPIGVRLAHFVMSDDQEDMQAPLATIFYMPPNYVLRRHAHECHRVEVIIEGTVQVGDKVLRAGDVSVSGPGIAYGPHTAGPTGCLTVEIFSRHAALEPLLEPETWKGEGG